MSDLLQQVDQAIQAQRLIAPGERILVGVSGGVDSMVLLHTLAQLAPRHNWRLEVAHLNHQLRGRSSDADERLVVRAAKALDMAAHVGQADVRGRARKEKVSMEMAARDARHEFFAQTAAARKIKNLALAHHADDQVELFLLRLLRGASPEGLAGTPPTSPSFVDPQLRIVRPFLACPKSDLVAYAREQKIAFRKDASNASLDFMRNRIRNKLIPELRKNYQPALERTILRLMEILRAESEFVSGAAEAPVEPFETLPIAIQRRMINAQLCGMAMDGSFDLIESLRLHPDTPISVGPEKAVRRDKSGKVVVCGTLAVAFYGEKTKADLAPKRGEIEFGGLSISWDRSQKRGSTEGEAFDADRVGPVATLRHWQPGDRFQPIGMPSAVKLQDLFTNLKIPRETRRQLVVAASATGELFWVEGCRMSENHKLTPATRKVLHWKWKRRLPIPNVVNANLSKADE